mmetsp:Transcript_14751/g.22713  ORF Transcript_14751/g.22713 Transcript_14751/m.22713 type:complete len:118 (+) Transcript_14751:3-356(+)
MKHNNNKTKTILLLLLITMPRYHCHCGEQHHNNRGCGYNKDSHGCAYYGGHRGHPCPGGCQSWHEGPARPNYEPDYFSEEEPPSDNNMVNALKDLQKLVSTLSKKISVLEKKKGRNG